MSLTFVGKKPDNYDNKSWRGIRMDDIRKVVEMMKVKILIWAGLIVEA